MPLRMAKDVGKKIERLRMLLNESQSVFAERFDVEQATISRWEQGKSPVQRKYQEQMATLAGMSVGEFFHSDEGPRLIPIIGELASGDKFAPKDRRPPGAPVESIVLSLGENDQIAVRVKGDSMFPVYRDGDVVIAKRIAKSKIASAIGRDCIVKTADGEGYVRLLRKGSRRGVYRLRAFSPTEDDIEDVDVEWVAPIVWIGRAQ